MSQSRLISAIDYLNPAIIQILHTPILHWLASPGLATISLRGRRSGKFVQLPVGYHDQEDAIVVMVSDARGRQWWRNFQSSRAATLQVRGRPIEMVGDVLEPGSLEFADRVGRFFSRAAFIPRIFGVDFDRRVGLTSSQVESLGATAAVVRFRPSG